MLLRIFLTCRRFLGKSRNIPPRERTAWKVGQNETSPAVRDVFATGRAQGGRHLTGLEVYDPLLSRDLARRGRRVGEVGNELGVARLRVVRCLLFYRSIAADTIRQ